MDKMRIKADYHIHSIYSKNNHGKSTIKEIVEASVKLGLEEIAISDHGPKHFLFGIKEKNLVKVKNEILEMRKKYPQIKILQGVESNILSYNGDTDISDEVIKNCDIILCGYHAGVAFSSFKDVWNFYIMNFLAKFNKKLKEKQIEKNTKAIVNAINKNNIHILTHPGDKIPVNIEEIAKVAEKNDVMLEINNHHTHLSIEEIKIASKYNVNFVIGSDSHIKDNIANFDNALKRAKSAGLDLKRIINIHID